MHPQLMGFGLLFATLANSGKCTTSLVQSYEVSLGGSISSSGCNRFSASRRPRLFASALSCRGLQCRGGNTATNRLLLHKSSSKLSMAQARNMYDTSTDDFNMEQYHLVWSPNFWKKMTASLIFWAVLWSIQKKINFPIGALFNDSRATCHHDNLLTKISREFPMKFALPLLSSSCCAIQLAINAISGLGCAGFNAYLGPVRPLFLSIFLILTWKQMQQGKLLSTAASLVLAFLPEAVYFWNKFVTCNFKRTDKSGNQPVIEDEALSRLPVKATVVLDIPTMGCVACVNKVDSSIRSCAFSNNIRQERSWLKDGKGGVAELIVSAEHSDDVQKISEEVVVALGKAGFQCKVQSIDLNAD